MTTTPDETSTQSDEQTGGPAPSSGAATLRSWTHRLGFVRFSGLYGLVLLIIIFGATDADLFLTRVNLQVILVNSSITGLLAIGVLIPLSAGQLDLSFGSVTGFAVIFTAWLSANSAMNSWLVAVTAIACCAGFGLASGLLVGILHLDSLIVTLGVSSLALGVTEYIANGDTLTARLDPAMVKIGLNSVGPIPYLAIILAVVSVAVYTWLEHTIGGRRTLAAGNNPDAARLAGLHVTRIQILSLVVSGAIAGLAGVLYIARVGSAGSTAGSGFLLPVVAAVFLGTTQVLTRPNVIGTVIAVYLLGVGVEGLQLRGNNPWVSDVFNGVVLLLAIAIAVVRRRQTTSTRDIAAPATTAA